MDNTVSTPNMLSIAVTCSSSLSFDKKRFFISLAQSMTRLKVGDATKMHPITSNKRARHFVALILRPNNTTANAAVEKIFSYNRRMNEQKEEQQNKWGVNE